MKAFLILLFSFFPLYALVHGKDVESFKQGGFEYFIVSDTSVAISDDGGMAVPIVEDSTLTIPPCVKFEGKCYYVDRIKRGAFATRLEIKHLVISEGVKYIEFGAFVRCSNLASVHIPSTFTCVECHGEGLFLGCGNLCQITVNEQNEEFDSRDNCNAIISTEGNILVFGCLGTKIPSTVTTIASNAFRHCQRLERMFIPEGVKRIESFAFKDCPNLKEILLPNSLESIGSHVFENCMSLESITIPQNVTQVCGSLFGGCYNLKEIKVDKRNKIFDSRDNSNAVIDSAQDTIVAGCGSSVVLEGIRGIGAYAFANSSIKRIEIPKSVRKIGDRAFVGCRFCNAISVDSDNLIYNSEGNCNAIIETATGKILQGCSQTTIPNNVKEIGDYAFWGIPLYPYLVIPEGVEVIGVCSFSRFNGLEFVQMPSTLKRVRERAFAGCDCLCYVDMSRCCARVDEFAFSGCSSLYAVDFSSTPGEVSELAFVGSPCEERVKIFLSHSK